MLTNQYFHNFHQFLMMGGFGDYVWSAFGITFVVLFWLSFSTWRQSKKYIPKKIKGE